VAAVAAGAKEILDPRRFAAPEIQAVFERFPHLGRVLPAMGYSAAQRLALQKTIEASGADVVVAGTPIDLRAELDLKVRVVRARYSYADADTPGLGDVIDEFATRRAGA
jgi:predicted GTPase